MKLNTCCGCISLKVGTVIIGLLGIILSIINIILLYTTDMQFRTIVIDALPQWIVKIILVINLCMTILISILLIVGALKKITFLMLPWIVLSIVLAVGILISIIVTAVQIFTNSHTVLNGILLIVFGIITLVVFIYLWFVVYSYFQHLRFEKTNVRLGPYGRPYNYRKP